MLDEKLQQLFQVCLYIYIFSVGASSNMLLLQYSFCFQVTLTKNWIEVDSVAAPHLADSCASYQ